MIGKYTIKVDAYGWHGTYSEKLEIIDQGQGVISIVSNGLVAIQIDALINILNDFKNGLRDKEEVRQ